MSLLIPSIPLNPKTPIWGVHHNEIWPSFLTYKCNWKVCAVFISEGEFTLKMHSFNQGTEEQVAKGYTVDEGKEVLYEIPQLQCVPCLYATKVCTLTKVHPKDF